MLLSCRPMDRREEDEDHVFFVVKTDVEPAAASS